MRARLEAIARAAATVTMFFELIPHPLPAWLGAQMQRADDAADAADAALTMVDTSLRREVAAMNAAGLFHFDAHLGNLLTDGHDVYLADFGLATSPHFDLTREESTFLAANLSHDPCHTATRLVDWLVTELTPITDADARDDFVRASAAGHEPVDLLPSAAAIVTRDAPVAVVVNAFYRRLHREDRRSQYPTDAIDRACVASGFPRPWRSGPSAQALISYGSA